jgi:hypothetical protein
MNDGREIDGISRSIPPLSRAETAGFRSMNASMQHHGVTDNGGGTQGNRAAISRREAVAGGGLLLGTLFLGACGENKLSTALPGPYWADPASTAPISNDIHSAPITAAPIPSGPITPMDPSPMPGIVPRAMWARGVPKMNEINYMNGIRRITVHHDGMPPASLSSVRQIAARIEQIRQSHVGGRGWADLGYHYVIDPNGRVWEGRDIRFQGAHVKDQNENNLGILVMGNFMVQSPTQAALASLDRFVANQMQRYNISISNVRTHQERAATDCPGRNLQTYMNRTRSGSGTLFTFARSAGLTR